GASRGELLPAPLPNVPDTGCVFDRLLGWTRDAGAVGHDVRCDVREHDHRVVHHDAYSLHDQSFPLLGIDAAQYPTPYVVQLGVHIAAAVLGAPTVFRTRQTRAEPHHVLEAEVAAVVGNAWELTAQLVVAPLLG